MSSSVNWLGALRFKLTKVPVAIRHVFIFIENRFKACIECFKPLDNCAYFKNFTRLTVQIC